MWFDESGFKHNGPSPYMQRKLKELRAQMTVEEKYKEKVDEACRWLNNILYSDPYTPNSEVVIHPLARKSKTELIEHFREIMKIT